jgi:archaellum component FlaC
MEQAAEDLAALQTEGKYYKQLYNEVAAKLNTANSKISRIYDICVSSI